MTTEQSYIKYICSNCMNPNDEECEIRRRYDNTTFCKGYIKGNKLEGYKKPLERTANIGHCVMPKLITSWK